MTESQKRRIVQLASDCEHSLLLAARAAVAELVASMPALIDVAAGKAPVALGVIRRAEAALARVQGGAA